MLASYQEKRVAALKFDKQRAFKKHMLKPNRHSRLHRNGLLFFFFSFFVTLRGKDTPSSRRVYPRKPMYRYLHFQGRELHSEPRAWNYLVSIEPTQQDELGPRKKLEILIRAPKPKASSTETSNQSRTVPASIPS